MPDIQAQTADGVIHSFPDGTSPEVMDAAIKKYVSANASYSEAGAAAHPPKAPVQSMRAAFDMPSDLQGKEMLQSPIMPFGSAFLSAPKFAGGLAGSFAGSKGGEYLADALHMSPNARGYVRDVGGLVGGALGTGSATQAEDIFPSIKDAIGRTFRNPGKVTLSPGGEVPDVITKGPLKPIPKAIANVGKIFGGPQIADAIIPANPDPVGMTSKLGRIKPAYSEALSRSRAGGATDAGADFTSDDLISRTRKITIPGDEPTPQDLKRAGDLTQAPVEKLKQLAKFGDKLAQNELNRRLQN